jgi:hypothetical protein
MVAWLSAAVATGASAGLGKNGFGDENGTTEESARARGCTALCM